MESSGDRRFVVVSGLPGSGKSHLARRLAPLLGLGGIDKDEILERLFDSTGIGDAAWRRTLSRESDRILQREAEASSGALLVSFWRLPGMAADSGTPTDWLRRLSRRVVNLHCACPADVAAARFIARKRHPGHLDDTRAPQEILESIRDLEHFRPLEIGLRISVDTLTETDAADVAAGISRAFSALR